MGPGTSVNAHHTRIVSSRMTGAPHSALQRVALPRPCCSSRPTVPTPRPRLIGKVSPQPFAHFVGLFGRPAAEPLAALHAEFAGLDLFAQKRIRTWGTVKIGREHLADVEREIEAHEIGLFH